MNFVQLTKNLALPLFRGGVSLLIWVLAGVLMAQVFFRYGLNNSLIWSEEFARYVLVGLAFTASIELIATRRLTAFGDNATPRNGWLARLLTAIPAAAFYGFFGLSVWQFLMRSGAQKSIALGWPMGMVYAPLLIFSCAGVLITLIHLFTGASRSHSAG